MGQDKALMHFLGRPLISRLVDRLSPLADELLVTTNHPDDYAFLGLPLFADILPGQGALGGIYTALSAARQPLVAIVACDMPFVSPALLAAQCDLLEKEAADVVIPHSEVGFEPLHGFYRRETCLPAVRSALERGERRAISWFPTVRVRVMEPDELRLYDPQLLSFTNVNSPEEFHAAEKLARQLGE
jgi:molybdopterin-guanine dinucleotide biosynthesis protein A